MCRVLWCSVCGVCFWLVVWVVCVVLLIICCSWCFWLLLSWKLFGLGIMLGKYMLVWNCLVLLKWIGSSFFLCMMVVVELLVLKLMLRCMGSFGGD